jgi:DedD protein
VSKPAAKKTDKSADSSSEGVSGRTETDDAQRANALLSGKSSAPAKGGGGRHVIMVGAFANAENARQLQAKLGSAGVSAYTEVLDSPDGKKTRVRAGPFASREAAEKALEQMKRVGVSGVVSSRQ